MAREPWQEFTNGRVHRCERVRGSPTVLRTDVADGLISIK